MCSTYRMPIARPKQFPWVFSSPPSSLQWPTWLFPDGKGQAWIKHSIEEMGYLENFLLELYEREAKHEADRVAVV